MLLDGGANVNQATSDNGRTALITACRQGYVEIVALLLERGADIDQGTTDIGWTPLMYACQSNSDETVKLLLERGANVNKRTKYGWTALDQAERDDYRTISEILRRAGGENGKRNERGPGE